MKRANWIAAAAGTLIAAGVQAQDTKNIRPMTREDATTLNFDKDTVGKLPPGWKAAESVTEKAPGRGEDPLNPASPAPMEPGKPAPAAPKEPGKAPEPDRGLMKSMWAVVADPTAPTTPNVLELTGSVQAENGYNICIYERQSSKDVDLSAKLRANTGQIAQGGGIAWRVRSPNSFYACDYNPMDGKFRVYKVVEGKTHELAAADFKGAGPDASTWYTLNARMTGDQITCAINGQELLHASDTTIKDAGHVAVWARGDAGSSFDDVSIRKAAGETTDATPATEPRPASEPRPPSEPKPPKDD